MAQRAQARPPPGAAQDQGDLIDDRTAPAPKRLKSVQDMGSRQAAVFLVSLGSDISAEIFKHLRETRSSP